jgi:hypothetical protein
MPERGKVIDMASLSETRKVLVVPQLLHLLKTWFRVHGLGELAHLHDRIGIVEARSERGAYRMA